MTDAAGPPTPGTIPPVLHQIWTDHDVPAVWRPWVASWRRFHPDWRYRLWTDVECRALVAQAYPALLARYDAYPYDIQRADVARYLVLHSQGGVYADLDVECLRPFGPLLAGRTFVAGCEPAEHGRADVLCNAVLAAAPGHPFLTAVIDRLSRAPATALVHQDVLTSTGPLLLTEAWRDHRGGDVTVASAHCFYPFPNQSPAFLTLAQAGSAADAVRADCVARGGYAIHYWSNSWVKNLAGALHNPDPDHVEGYVFCRGWDSAGFDLANLGRDVPALARACAEREDVVAFNTDGFVKSRLRWRWRRLRGAANEGLYVKAELLPLREHYLGLALRAVRGASWVERWRQGPIGRAYADALASRVVDEWQAAGRPFRTPHAYKQRLVREHARAFGLRELVETGTHHGDMVSAVLGDFDRVYTIELSHELHRRACQRFAHAPQVVLLGGDSERLLPGVVSRLDGPALFWLDAHRVRYGRSARGRQDSAVMGELEAILAAGAPGHVVLIDDAHCFGRDPGFPTLSQVRGLVRSREPGAGVCVRDDVIRITPRPCAPADERPPATAVRAPAPPAPSPTTPARVLLDRFRRWRGRLGRASEVVALESTLSAQRWYSYVRGGFDQRLLELRPDGSIGRGGDRQESTWWVSRCDGQPTLFIAGSDGPSCRMRPMQVGAGWRGEWLRHERMPVRLQPVAAPVTAVPSAATHYRVLSLFRRTVGWHPGDKRLLPVASPSDAHASFGRARGELCEEVLFARLVDDTTGASCWAKRYTGSEAKQVGWELEIHRQLAALAPNAVTAADHVPELGLIFPFRGELFDRPAVHYEDIEAHFGAAEVEAIRAFAELRIRHSALGDATLLSLCDFQTVRTPSGLAFIDFALRPHHWWML